MAMSNKSMKTSSSSMNNTSLNDLPNDILLDILHRLPLKLAARYKSVSKRWFALISSPNFLHRYLFHRQRLFQHQQHHRCSFICEPRSTLVIPKLPPALESLGPLQKEFSLSFLGPESKIELKEEIELEKNRILGCSQGLLLCEKSMGLDSIYYICNPLTKDWIQLPLSPGEGLALVGFVCDPFSFIPNEAEMEFNSQPRRFRVVRIPKFYDTYFEFKVEVFSSEIGQWSKLVAKCPKGFACTTEFSMGVCHNGNLYFGGQESILVYDPYNYKSYAKTIDFPPNSSNFSTCLGLSCGSLRISQFLGDLYDSIHAPTLSVWELDEYTNETGTRSLVHKIELAADVWRNVRDHGGGYRFTIVGFHPDDGDILFLHLTNITNHSYSYNFRTKQVRRLSKMMVCLYTAGIQCYQFCSRVAQLQFLCCYKGKSKMNLEVYEKLSKKIFNMGGDWPIR
ncbi:F-box protein [Quillaja saponaria]|uniref:F-box protein n=1 Tax=Quillaja saponaria TaxID=32244 RepID=A0AAD7VKL9_QUISA|nr:F-box protein [Quillaja saponaria]